MLRLITPSIFLIVISLKPAFKSSLQIAVPAAPAPDIATTQSSGFLPVSLSAFLIPESTTTAVPCWSSWKTGISHFSFNFLSISKQRGAEISSRFMPPKLPAISETAFTNSSGSLLRTQRGNASTLPNSLKSTHLPSITGIPASGPISPRPKTALPSVITATILWRLVSVYCNSGFFFIARQGSATPGV